jgi:GntR family transcriptional regulator/MocR family aminotransferase
MDEWATSHGSPSGYGFDLHLELAVGADSGIGLRAGLEAALRDAVREGRLPPGTRLPSSRTLARDLGIARNTVADAYGQLVAEGWLAARQGSGTRVAGRAGGWADPAASGSPHSGGQPDRAAHPRKHSTTPSDRTHRAAQEAISRRTARGRGRGGLVERLAASADRPPRTAPGTRARPTPRHEAEAIAPHLGDAVPPTAVQPTVGRRELPSRRMDGAAAAAARLTEAPPERRRLPYDLRPGSPDLSSFPRSAWLGAARVAVNRAPYEAFGYTDPRGRPELRQALAGYLARVRGVRADPELMVVCTGFQQVVGLLGRALTQGGARRIAVEALGFPDTRTALRATGLTTCEIPVDDVGACVDSLDRVNADAALLTPSHQYPSGVPLSPARRTEAVAWARRTAGVLIEDDYDGEFRYDRQPVGALQGLDPACVVYAGTASKSLMPGLRLAWTVLPEPLLEPVVLQKRMADHHSPVLDQLTLAEFIDSGAYDRHVRRMRLHYRRRRDRLVAALAAQAPRVKVSGIAAGLHAVVELPPGAPSEAEVVRRAARLGLALTGTAFYGPVHSAAGAALVIGFGSPPEHAFSGALERLCAVLGTC